MRSWVLALVAALVTGCSGTHTTSAQAGPGGGQPAPTVSATSSGADQRVADDAVGSAAAEDITDTARCQKNRGCPVAAPLPACPAEPQIQSLAEVLTSGTRLLGHKLAVRGPLRHSAVACAPNDCTGPCCHTCGAHLVLSDRDGVPWPAGAPGALLLDDVTAALTCTGDDSAVCCTPSAGAGEVVVAIGTLRRGGFSMSSPTRSLADTTLCAEPVP